MDAHLPDGEVHLWRARFTSAELDRADGVLQADEIERAQRYRRPADAAEFVGTRTLLRTLAGAYLELDPRAVRFEYGRFGKPLFAGSARWLSFSVAHSGGSALLAFAPNRQIGADLELIRKPAPLDVAGQFFTRDEHREILALSGPARDGAFYRCWTRKEAYVKATGLGLSAPLDSFAVPLDPGTSEAMLSGRRFLFLEPPVEDGFAAALAVEAGPVQLVVRDWEPRAVQASEPVMRVA